MEVKDRLFYLGTLYQIEAITEGAIAVSENSQQRVWFQKSWMCENSKDFLDPKPTTNHFLEDIDLQGQLTTVSIYRRTQLTSQKLCQLHSLQN